MSTPRRTSSHKFTPKLLLGLLALVLGLLAPPMAALAHPLDVYLQASYITVAPTQIVVELDLSPGVLVAPQVLPLLDSNSDQQISDAEGRAYAGEVLRHVALVVDGQPLALALTTIDMPAYLNIQAGYGMIRIFASASLPDGAGAVRQLAYANNFAPAGSAYQVNAFVEKGAAITLGKQNRDSTQQRLALDYTVDGATLATAAPAATPATATAGEATPDTTSGMLGGSEQARELLAYLRGPALSPWALLLVLLLAVVLGGLHALTPGHGKTLVAAYLVGSRGTVRHAVALGAIVTFTHTASVIVIGLLALFASRFVVPDVLIPVLESLAGLLVVGLGTRLVWQRWAALRTGQGHSHDHNHSHAHDHTHAHGLTHDHGDGHVHTHLPPAEGLTMGSLLAMGVSGGLVPCPEALGIMVIAIGLNRIALGLGLIVAFSFGLAAVLIGIGILLVRSRVLLERFGGLGSRWSRVLPLCSAVLVTVLGLGITLSGLGSYLW